LIRNPSLGWGDPSIGFVTYDPDSREITGIGSVSYLDVIGGEGER
jgi:hypothetical protein